MSLISLRGYRERAKTRTRTRLEGDATRVCTLSDPLSLAKLKTIHGVFSVFVKGHFCGCVEAIRKCGLSLLVVYSAPGEVSPGALVFDSPQKSTFTLN